MTILLYLGLFVAGCMVGMILAATFAAAGQSDAYEEGYQDGRMERDVNG